MAWNFLDEEDDAGFVEPVEELDGLEGLMVVVVGRTTVAAV
jgi:hypothetical protein